MKKVLAVVGLAVLSVTMLAGWRSYGGPIDAQKLSRIVGARVDNVLDDVDATDAQRLKVKAIQERLIKDGIALRDQQKDTRKELLAQWELANPDRSKIHSLVDQRMDELKAFAHKVADAMIEFHGILSPQQRATLTEKVKDRMGE